MIVAGVGLIILGCLIFYMGTQKQHAHAAEKSRHNAQLEQMVEEYRSTYGHTKAGTNFLNHYETAALHRAKKLEQGGYAVGQQLGRGSLGGAFIAAAIQGVVGEFIGSRAEKKIAGGNKTQKQISLEDSILKTLLRFLELDGSGQMSGFQVFSGVGVLITGVVVLTIYFTSPR